MVYLDTSVALAHLRAEDVRPPDALWDESLVASRLLEYETLSRLHAQGRSTTHGDAARDILRRVAMLELVEPVIARAADPYPVGVRTLDALHLASMLFVLDQGVDLQLASYDHRLSEAAAMMGIVSYPLTTTES